MPLLATHVHVVAYDRAGLGGSLTSLSYAAQTPRRARRCSGAAQRAPALPDVPVVVLSASRGFPRRFRAHWTGLQAELAAAPQGRHLVINDVGHNIPEDQPGAVADAILNVAAQARPLARHDGQCWA